MRAVGSRPMIAFKMCRTASVVLFAIALVSSAAAAQPASPASSSDSPQPPRRPKIGLALGGGGARGAAHIGVLKVLEELRIPIDYVAGTSMGSVVGGLYVVGYSPEGLDKVVQKVDWANIFVDSAPRPDTAFRQKENDYLVPPGITLGVKKGSVALPAGLIAGRKLSFLLNTLTLSAIGVQNFDNLPIPFRAVAADARTGETVVLSRGSLPRSIRASMAIPVIFTPIEQDGRLLMDGGEAENLPVQTVRAMGADIVIAVDVASSSEIPKEAPSSLAQIVGRLIDLPLLRNTLESRKLADLVITPELSGFSSGDFPAVAKIVPKGEEAARALSDKLSRWSVSEEEYRDWQKAHRIPLPEHPPMVDDVVVDPIKGFDTRRISRVIATKAGAPFDESVLQSDMRRIAGMGLWQNVEFQLEKEDGKQVLHIIAVPKSWGPTYLSAGLDFEISDARADFDISVLLDATERNRLGADWKTGVRLGTELALVSQFFQPLDYAGRFYAAPRIGWDQQTREVFSDETRVAEYRVRQGQVGVDLGMELGHLLSLGELSVGVQRGYADAARRIGIQEFPNFDIDTGAFVASLRLDQLDNLWFPRSGYYLDLNYTGSRTALGGEDSYNRALLRVIGAHSIGRWTAQLRASYGDGFNRQLPFYDGFSLGGFRNLSGRPPNQLTGQTLAFASVEFRYALTPKPGAVVKGLYVGATAEAGNVWDSRNLASLSDLKRAGSVFIVTDTLLGPVYLAWGYSGKNNNAFYLFLNRSF
jgi:NTE family protein